VGKIVLADAAHTQVATAKQILYEQGGDYLLTVKKNQKGLFETEVRRSFIGKSLILGTICCFIA
jgi:predicted transposase YbfD/YdcC